MVRAKAVEVIDPCLLQEALQDCYAAERRYETLLRKVIGDLKHGDSKAVHRLLVELQESATAGRS